MDIFNDGEYVGTLVGTLDDGEYVAFVVIIDGALVDVPCVGIYAGPNDGEYVAFVVIIVGVLVGN